MKGEQRGFAQCKIPLCGENGQVDMVTGREIWKDEWTEKDGLLPCTTHREEKSKSQ